MDENAGQPAGLATLVPPGRSLRFSCGDWAFRALRSSLVASKLLHGCRLFFMCVHDGGVDRKGLAPFVPLVLSRPLRPVGYPVLAAVARLLCPAVIAVAGFSTGKSTGYSSRG